MRTWILLTILLALAVTGYGDMWGLTHWSKTEEELLKCLEKTELPNILKDNIIYAQERSYVIERIAYLFHKQTEAAESIEVIANDLVRVVKEHLYYLHQQTVTEESLYTVANITFEEDQEKRVKKAITSALRRCSDPEDSDGEMIARTIAPPYFVQEIPEIAELLNTILVYDSPVRFMHARPDQWEFSRFTSFSERALTITQMALHKTDFARKLFEELNRMWRRRAGLFYIDRYGRPDYLSFRYSPYRAGVYTFLTDVIHARLVNLTVRDEPATIKNNLFQMTSYRALDWNNFTNSRVFSVPSTANETTTKAQYYFERQTHQFFQGLFAYLESVQRGLTYGSGYNEWEAFKKELPMLWTDSWDGYEAYLKELQSRELSHEFATNSHIFSTLARSLKQGEQINEFDLALMYWHRLRSDYFIYKLVAKVHKMSDFLMSYWNRPKYVDIVNVTAENWNFRDTLGKITNLLKSYWQRLRSPQTLSLEDQSSEFSEAGPSNSRTTTTVTTTSTTTFSSSTDSSSKKGKGSVARLPSGKYVWKNHEESIDDDSSSYYSASDDECESYQDLDDIADNYNKYTVDSDNLENDFILTSEFLQDTFMTLFQSQSRAVGGPSCFRD